MNDDWVEVPLPQVEEPDLEAVRKIAHEMAYHMDFHEIAIDDPFKAESYVTDMGRQLMALVGWPKGWTMWAHPDDVAAAAPVSTEPGEEMT